MKKLKNLIDKWAEAVLDPYCNKWKKSPDKLKKDLEIRSAIQVMITDIKGEIPRSTKGNILERVDYVFVDKVIKHKVPIDEVYKQNSTKSAEEWWKDISFIKKKCMDEAPNRQHVVKVTKPKMEGDTLIYSVKVITQDGIVDAKIARTAESSLGISFEDKEYTESYTKNWYKTLRNLDRQVNAAGYKILCNGTAKDYVCHGFCINMANGRKMYDWRKINTPKAPTATVDTFGYDKTLEYATEEEQEEFYNAK